MILTEQNVNQTESIATADRSERLQKFHNIASSTIAMFISY